MRIETQNKFFDRLHKKAIKERIPLRVIFEITYRCNFSCQYCYIPKSYRKIKELTTEEVFSILRNLAKEGSFYLGFSGGEPFLRDDFLEILEFSKRLGFFITINTNASLINKKIARKIVELGINKVDINLVSLNETIFKKITKSSAFSKVLDIIYFLKDKIHLGLKTCITKDNFTQIEDIKKFAKSIGGFLRLDDRLSSCLDGETSPHKFSIYEKIENLDLSLFLEKKSLIKRKFKAIDIFSCKAGFLQCAINPAGKIKICVGIDAPLYSCKKSFKRAWQRLGDFLNSIKIDDRFKCFRCKLKNFCDWCPAKSYIEHRDFISCDRESRFFAYQAYKKYYERKNISKNSRCSSFIRK
ncbi:MAG: radical SAM protein [Candidatus Omnitrophica bacterium]|nr:radical SAM protein [Candidatus Omnitrophota bacterium]